MKNSASFAVLALAASTSASVVPRTANMATSSDIEQRFDIEQRQSCFQPIFALSAGFFAGTFWYDAAGVCPATANADNVNHAQCALASTLGVWFTLLTAFSVYGQLTRGVTTRDSNSTGLHLDLEAIQGYSTRLLRAGSELDDLYSDRDGWVHHYVDHTDLSGAGKNLSTVFSTHESGHRRIASTGSPTTDDQLQKRAGYTVYYSWQNGDTSDFSGQNICQTREAAEDLTEAVYNYGHSTNQNHFCANLMGDRGVRLTQGDFAVVPTDTFISFENRCP